MSYRFDLGRSCPSILRIESSIPLTVDTLEFRSDRIKINRILYHFEIIVSEESCFTQITVTDLSDMSNFITTFEGEDNIHYSPKHLIKTMFGRNIHPIRIKNFMIRILDDSLLENLKFHVRKLRAFGHDALRAFSKFAVSNYPLEILELGKQLDSSDSCFQLDVVKTAKLIRWDVLNYELFATKMERVKSLSNERIMIATIGTFSDLKSLCELAQHWASNERTDGNSIAIIISVATSYQMWYLLQNRLGAFITTTL